jgi:hypothetical protein
LDERERRFLPCAENDEKRGMNEEGGAGMVRGVF